MSGRGVAPPPRPGLMFRMALADLRWDALMTATVVLSLAATIAPLLILFSLKSGVINAMRADLIEDPVFREVRPTETRNYDGGFFARWSGREDVAFIVPSITRGASAVIVESGENRAILDMLPTAEGDPLLESFGVAAPERGCVALSAEAAAQLGDVAAGETVRLTSTRIRDGREERAEIDACVAAVLPLRADALPRVYVRLDLAVDIEGFREGFAAPARGWPGETPFLPPAFDGVFVSAPRRLSAVTRAELSTTTGFFLAEDADEDDFAAQFTRAPPQGEVLLRLSVIDQGADSRAVDRVRTRLAGRAHALFPYVDAVRVRLGADVAGEARAIVITDAELPDQPADGVSALARVTAPAGLGLEPGDETVAAVEAVNGLLEVPAVVEAVHDRDEVGLPLAFAALLRRSLDRAARYDAGADQLLVARDGYRGFRLYARSIDDVIAIANELQDEDVAVVAQVQAIERIRVLDHGLSVLFLLIALIAGAGAGAAVLANLYGAVERKRAELGHLRLLGFRRRAVAMFPLYQGGVIAMASSALAYVLAAGGAAIINASVGGSLGFERAAADLSPQMGFAAGALALVAGAGASIVAAARAMSIDPAEAIRDD